MLVNRQHTHPHSQDKSINNISNNYQTNDKPHQAPTDIDKGQADRHTHTHNRDSNIGKTSQDWSTYNMSTERKKEKRILKNRSESCSVFKGNQS